MADLKRGQELVTLHLSPPTGAKFIRVEYGRALIARENYIVASSPLNFDLFDEAYNTIPFDSIVTGIECTGDGWYVGTEKGLYFLQGTDLDSLKVARLNYAGVVSGTMTRVERKYIVDKGRDAIYWLGTDGLFYSGSPGGEVAPLAAGRFKVGRFASGASLTRQLRGSRSVLFTVSPTNLDAERGIAQVVPPLAPYKLQGAAQLGAVVCGI
ncbi:MAG: hypothetical protein JSR83_01720 [Proteobacteria bacterium]|nr:hypothetical protein [Pseudomonadota bacterium]